MCLAIPMLIESIDGTTATVSAAGARLSANVMLVENPRIGDYVLVHAGFAIRIIDEDEAAKTITELNRLLSTAKYSDG